jgi:outer membrane protein OmpA-like peptidoglycan-associated protein
MRTTYFLALSILAATTNLAAAQETSTDTEAMTEEVIEDVIDNDMADEASDTGMADDVMDADMADDAMDADMADNAMETDMAEEVMEETAPSLEEIAAADPALDVRTNEDGDVDAMVMLSDVLFGFGDASLVPSALDVLRGVAAKLDGVPSIEITGHTDAIGDADFNLALGQRRADAVRDWLVVNTDLTADVITARGVGEVDPIAPNTTEVGADNPEGRAQNRRVEFTLPDEG